MPGELDLAFVLRLVPYRDADLVVTLLTQHHGLISLMARGARKSQKRFSGALDYLTLIRATFKKPRSGMGTLTAAESARSYEKIRGDLAGYHLAMHFFEVTRLATREGDDANEPFLLLGHLLTLLERGGDRTSALRIFHLKTISHLGYAPSELACASCGAGLHESEAHLHEGGLICPPCGAGSGAPLSKGAVNSIVRATALPYENFSSFKLSLQVEREIGPVVEAALIRALGAEPRSLEQLHEMLKA